MAFHKYKDGSGWYQRGSDCCGGFWTKSYREKPSKPPGVGTNIMAVIAVIGLIVMFITDTKFREIFMPFVIYVGVIASIIGVMGWRQLYQERKDKALKKSKKEYLALVESCRVALKNERELTDEQKLNYDTRGTSKEERFYSAVVESYRVPLLKRQEKEFEQE